MDKQTRNAIDYLTYKLKCLRTQVCQLENGGGEGGPETDPIFTASAAFDITSTDVDNWDVAFGWGNHASAGYLSAATAGTTYQTLANLSTDLTASATKYPSVNAVNTGLGLKANLASPTFTGTPAAPTATGGTNTTQIATTAFVTTAVSTKANLASPALTGTPTAPTATFGTNTTQIATTAFVATNYAPLVLTGYTSGAGTVSATDSVLQAIQKLNGNIGAVSTSLSGYVDTTNPQTVGGAKTLTGLLVTVNVQPDGNGTRDIGTTSLKYQTVFANRVNAMGTLSLISSSSNAILFSQTSPSAGIMGGFAATTGHFIIQAPNTTLTASTGELVQFNGTAKITGATSIGGNLTLTSIPALATPSIRVLTDNSGVISSRTIAEFREDLFDPLSEGRIAYAEAQGNSASMNSLGLGVTALGTTTSRPVNHSTTNFSARQRRLGYIGATTANAGAGITCQPQFSIYYGFIFKARFTIQVYDAGHRYTCGIGETNTMTVEPSTLLNRIHIYADAGDTTFKLVSADATTVGTPINLGANFPVNTSATDVYDVTFEVEANSSSVKYTINRLGTGFVATGTLTTNLPVNTTLLAPQVFASNAATGTAASINIMRINMITDY